jgi:hypothetical protein
VFDSVVEEMPNDTLAVQLNVGFEWGARRLLCDGRTVTQGQNASGETSG